jgi:putative ABC transport system permease protein
MIIGVAALVSMVGIAEGTHRRVIQDMERLGGTGLIIIELRAPQYSDAFNIDLIEDLLTREELKALKRASNQIEKTAPVLMMRETFYSDRYQTTDRCFGITAEYAKIRDWHIGAGRFILESDLEHSKKVCIIGSEVRAKLFNKVDPIGKRMRIGHDIFTIVGLMSERDFEAGRWMNHLVLIPLTTMERRLAKPGYLNKILVKARSTSMVSVLKRQIQRVLEGRHENTKRFNIFSQEEVIHSVNKSTTLLRLSHGISAAIVLLVGGIGIMNLMLVSVTERTKEIGLRKAVGATELNILRQFLQEAVIISTLGGIIGIIVGLVMGDILSYYIAINLQDNIQSIVSVKDICLATIFVFMVGIFFGLYPAIRAARLDPSKALSYE